MDDDLFRAAIQGNINAIRNLREKIDQVTKKDGSTILHLASAYGKTECMQFILTEFANKNFLIKLDKMQGTALHWAAVEGHVDAVELLINAARGLPEFEKFIRHADEDGDTALHTAVYENKVEVVKLLVKADPNHEHSPNNNDFKTPLYIAAERGYKDIVKVICESCTTPNFDGPDGKTALHAAVENRHIEGYVDSVELLINAARGLPEFEKFIRQRDVDGDTALHKAVYGNKVEVVKLLVKADPNHEHSPNNKFKTPLYIAAERGYKDIVKVICESCTTPNFDGPHGITALQAAVENSHIECVKLILEKRGDLVLRPDDAVEVEKFIRLADKSGNTALHLAVYKNEVEVVKLVVKADPNHVYSRNRDSKTPLYIAAEKGYKDIVKVICESCTTPNFDGPHGKTALHAAVENRHIDCMRVILDKRPDLAIRRDQRGWTATEYAASKNIVSVLDILVQTQNNLFHHDYSEYKHSFMERSNKETALHIAAYAGHISTVLQLMKLYPHFIWCAGNHDGQNILHIAVDRNHKELVQGVLKYCPDPSLLLNAKDKNGNTPLHLLVMRGCFIPELIKHERVYRNAKNNDNYTPYDLLYQNEDIIADQLKIKEALEDSQFINQLWNFGLRKRNPELITAESPVFPSMRYTKEAKFMKARDLLMKEEIKLYRERSNTQIIVTALITTVTFTVGFTMPGGYHQDEGKSNLGLAVLSKKTAFGVFMVADAVALLLSTSSLFSYFIASMYQDPREVSKLMAASTGFNIVSIVAMMLTFITGTYVVLPHSGLSLTVCVISCIFFLYVIFLSIKLIYDIQ